MDDDPDYQLSCNSETELAKDISWSRLQEAVSATLIHHHITCAQISFALVDDARITSINESFLCHEGPTDVITFDLRDEIATPSKSSQLVASQSNIDGEIVISVETALRESSLRGHSLEAEIALYAVHGTLHLLGFDDKSDHEAQQMHEMEDIILSGVGMGNVYDKTK